MGVPQLRLRGHRRGAERLSRDWLPPVDRHGDPGTPCDVAIPDDWGDAQRPREPFPSGFIGAMSAVVTDAGRTCRAPLRQPHWPCGPHHCTRHRSRRSESIASLGEPVAAAERQYLRRSDTEHRGRNMRPAIGRGRRDGGKCRSRPSHGTSGGRPAVRTWRLPERQPPCEHERRLTRQLGQVALLMIGAGQPLRPQRTLSISPARSAGRFPPRPPNRSEALT